MDGNAHGRDFLTALTWVVIVAGAVLSIVGYVRLGGAYYPCSLGGGGLCYSTEYQFDLAAMFAGFTIMLGGFAGFAHRATRFSKRTVKRLQHRGRTQSFAANEPLPTKRPLV